MVASTSCFCQTNVLTSLNTSPLSTNDGDGCTPIQFSRAPFSSNAESTTNNLTACVDAETFGSSCAAHWKTVFDDCTHGWCEEKWCFVDPVMCGLPSYDAHIVVGDGENINNNVALSYAACGNIGKCNTSWFSNAHLMQLDSKQLSVQLTLCLIFMKHRYLRFCRQIQPSKGGNNQCCVSQPQTECTRRALFYRFYRKTGRSHCGFYQPGFFRSTRFQCCGP